MMNLMDRYRQLSDKQKFLCFAALRLLYVGLILCSMFYVPVWILKSYYDDGKITLESVLQFNDFLKKTDAAYFLLPMAFLGAAAWEIVRAMLNLIINCPDTKKKKLKQPAEVLD
jgi:hypothetical protein